MPLTRTQKFLAIFGLALLVATVVAALLIPRQSLQRMGNYFEALAERFIDGEDEDAERERGAMMAEYLLKMEADENGPPTAAQIFRAVQQRETLLRERAANGIAKLAGVTSASWQAIGPTDIGGRIRTIAIDPRNASRILIGAAGGGIWLSENAGVSWRPINDFLGSLTVSTMMFDPTNPDIVYAGTGESSAGLVGVGIFKSADAGLTWTYLPSTTPDADQDWRFVNRIALHPQQAGVLLAGTTNGANFSRGAIFRSTNGGQSWTKVSTAKADDVDFDPNNAQNLVAGREDGSIAYSRDGGQTWQSTGALFASLTGRSSTARAEIAFAQSTPGLVYASIDNNKGEVWKSTDSGATWTMLSNPQHLSEQGDYDNALWVDPIDGNHVVAAGLDIYQSQDGGLNFTKVSDWRQAPTSPHADHHAIVAVPNYSAGNATVYFGNDGGLYRAANMRAVNSDPGFNGWTNMNNGLAITQFYGGAGTAAAGGKIIGGTQDNGTLARIGTAWTQYRGGDGGFVAVDPQSDNNLYGEYVYLALHRSQNGGANSFFICSGLLDGLTSENGNTYCGANAAKKANFIAPFILDPNNSNRLLAGGNDLWVSNNVKAPIPLWTSIKPGIGTDADKNYINAIAVAEGNANIVWVGNNLGQVFKSVNGTAATPAWTQMQALVARQVQRIMIDKADANHVIVAFTGFTANNLWETRDGGGSWASITGNLPQAPIFTVVRHPANANWLYVGTSVGVFASENGGQSWSTSNDGPANVRVRELFWYDANTLVAATYGRGMFKATIGAGSGTNNYQGVWYAGPTENGWGLALTQHNTTLVAGWYYYDATGKATWTIMPGCTWNAAFTICNGAIYNSTGAWFGNYNAAAFAQNQVGTLTFTFSDTNTGTMQYTVNGVSGQKNITRLSFGSGTPPTTTDYTDVWWAGQSQNGWGIAMAQQQAVLAASWYTYDAQGKATWFLMNGGTWTSASTFTGQVLRATGSPLIGTTYNAAAFNPVTAGPITLVFSDANNATMTYTVDGVTQTKNISRLAF